MDSSNDDTQEWINLILEARKADIAIGDIRLFLTNKIQLKQDTMKERIQRTKALQQYKNNQQFK